MCGRFAFFSPAEAIASLFGLSDIPTLTPHFNIAPSQDVFVIHKPDDQRIGEFFRWGLVPFWAKDPAIGNRMINARAETLAEKPSFRTAYKRRRCLLPVDGFFEWKKTPDGKQPWFISSAEAQPMLFAGLWDEWQGDEGNPLRSCTIITTAANGFMQDLHQRMPVIVSPDQAGIWLDNSSDRAATDAVLDKAHDTDLQAWPVSRRVNSPRNDDPDLIVASGE